MQFGIDASLVQYTLPGSLFSTGPTGSSGGAHDDDAEEEEDDDDGDDGDDHGGDNQDDDDDDDEPLRRYPGRTHRAPLCGTRGHRHHRYR